MIKAFGLGVNTSNYDEALKEVRNWLDKQQGVTSQAIKVEGNKTTVTLPDGRVGVSRCNPCDKFDIITGIRVALDDIERKSIKLTEDEIMCLKVAKKAGARYVVVHKYTASINDIYMTANKYVNDENNVLYLEDDNMFLNLDGGKFYEIDTLLKERS